MEKIILSIVVVLGTLIAFKFKGIFHKIISIGLAVSILLIFWTSNKLVITGGFIVVIFLSITTFIYGLKVKGLNRFERTSIAAMGLFCAYLMIAKTMHWPFATLTALSMIVPVIITLATFIKDKRLIKEMSFMLFWLSYAVSVVLKVIITIVSDKILLV